MEKLRQMVRVEWNHLLPHKMQRKRHTSSTPDAAAAPIGKSDSIAAASGEFLEMRNKVMENKMKNPSIHCTVTQCQHNLGTEQYCGLNSISVGTHESNPTVPECTDCESFVKRSDCCNA